MPTGAAVDSPKSLTRKKLWRGGKWGGQGTTRVGAGGTALAPGNGLPAPPGGSCHNRHAAPSTPRDGEKRQGEGWAVLHSAPVPSPRVSWDVGRSPVLDKETVDPLPPAAQPPPCTLHPPPCPQHSSFHQMPDLQAGKRRLQGPQLDFLATHLHHPWQRCLPAPPSGLL